MWYFETCCRTRNRFASARALGWVDHCKSAQGYTRRLPYRCAMPGRALRRQRSRTWNVRIGTCRQHPLRTWVCLSADVCDTPLVLRAGSRTPMTYSWHIRRRSRGTVHESSWPALSLQDRRRTCHMFHCQTVCEWTLGRRKQVWLPVRQRFRANSCFCILALFGLFRRLQPRRLSFTQVMLFGNPPVRSLVTVSLSYCSLGCLLRRLTTDAH